MTHSSRVSIATAAAAFALAAFAATAPAQAAFNLKGKTVTVYVAGGVGGGVDAFARTLTPYLAKYLPGDPAIVASNMPGGGGMQAMQYLYNVAAKDGTAIGTTNAGPVAEPLIGTTKVNYDMQRFRWIGSLAKGDTVCAAWGESPIKSLEDAKTREVTISATGATSAPTRSALLMNALLGTRFRPIAGYNGGTSLLAIERGEVDGTCVTLGSLRTTRPQWLRDKKIRLLVQVSLTADPDYPDVPRAADLIKSDDEKAMLEFFLIPYEFQNPFMLPPGAPDAALAAWRAAFDKAVADPAYRADALKRRQNVQPRTGPDVQSLVTAMFATPKAIIQRTIAATDPSGRVSDTK
jgi:tripartite-type tricarboxylate transporter receptor subunit TctC